MPKQKTHKATRKRFKVTKTGKVKRRSPSRRHLLSVKTTKRKRQLRKPKTCSPGDTARVKRLLCES